MKPICVPCQLYYRCIKTGMWFIEGMPIDNDAPPGRAAPDRWQPYKLWSGDLFQCIGCGHQTIAGVGREPLREQHEPDFKDVAARLNATFQVNDC